MDAKHSGQDRATYALALSEFLRYAPKKVLEDMGIPLGTIKTHLPEAVIAHLEGKAQCKSASAEDTSLRIGERLALARDYLGLSDEAIADAMDLELSQVKGWYELNGGIPRVSALAKLLRVPVSWLASGKWDDLPADSHLGVCCGVRLRVWQETLFSMTQAKICELIDSVPFEELDAALLHQVHSDPDLARAARRSGGYWQVAGSGLQFVPWSDSPMIWLHQGR